MTRRLITNRNAALKRQNGFCYYCRQPIWLGNIAAFCTRFGMSCRQALRHQATAEHLKARCDGGTDGRQNIVAACRFCNETRHKAKKPLSPERFAAKVLRHMAQGKWHGFSAL